MPVLPAVMMRAVDAPVVYRERFTPASANLQFLSCGEYSIAPGALTQTVAYPNEEALLFAWHGRARTRVDDAVFDLAHYDVLYVPRGSAFSIENPGPDAASLFVTRAPASGMHPVHHAEFAKLSKDESRIRRLKGKNVFLMFDVA